MKAVRATLIAVLTVLALTPAAGSLGYEFDIEEDAQPPDGEVNTPYKFQFAASGGCTPHRFAFSSGTLPPGLQLNREGLFSGTPTQAGDFDFYVEVDSACEGDLQSQGQFEMQIMPDLAVATTSVPRAAPGQPYTTTLAASGIEQGWSVTWLVTSGSFPPGLLMSPSGVISGTATTPGKWAAVVRVQEQFRRSGERELTFVVAAPLSLAGPSSQVGEVGLPFSSSLPASGGLAPMTYSVAAGSLPPGLTLNPTSGQVQGTPTAAGAFPVKFSLADSGDQQASVDAVFQIVAKLTVATASLRGGKVGKRYGAKLAASGGLRPLTWRQAGGSLPRGLTLRPNGTITGTPTASGTSTFTVEVRDNFGVRAKKKFSLTVTA